MSQLAYFARGAASAERARRRIKREGVTMRGDKLWTDEENAIIKKCGPSFDEIGKRLPHRTRTAIRFQSRKLGFCQKRQHNWTAAEISKLRRLYPRASREEICGIFSHSTWQNITQVARYHGARRECSKAYSPTGFPTLDEVRKRCREIRWTMPDLDKAARTGTYFARAGWIGKKINYRALGRAIAALDGEVKAAWND